jgi:lipoate-protein ligase A
MNMALDEAVFQLIIDGKLTAPLLRFYTWSSPCTTIGYFQKYAHFPASSVPVIRRLTGGLAVNHSHDISYSLVISERYLPCVRDQQKTYMTIHSALRAGLENAGIKTDYCAQNGDRRTNLCTASVFAHDLAIGGKKVLGSCQRRRGNVLLQQGSINIPISINQSFAQVAEAIAQGFAKSLAVTLKLSAISQEHKVLAKELAATKYSSTKWNGKF